jgi:hypothetical protein
MQFLKLKLKFEFGHCKQILGGTAGILNNFMPVFSNTHCIKKCLTQVIDLNKIHFYIYAENPFSVYEGYDQFES